MGGGSIIIHQAEALRENLKKPEFYNQLSDAQKDEADALIILPLADWTKAELRAAHALLGCSIG